jgi:hypothetical protein
MQGGQDRVADQMRRERQDGGHLVAGKFEPQAEEPGVGRALKERFHPFEGLIAHVIRPGSA